MVEKTRLNLGCGPTPKPDYYNVDIRPFEGVDLVADIRTLKFPDETFTEIHCKDMIEHISFAEAKQLLRNCHGWLKPKGVLLLHTQNMQFLGARIAETENYDDPFHFEVLRWIYGTGGEGDTNHPNGFHKWGYSRQSLSKILIGIGFRILEAETTCSGFGMAFVAVKGGD